MPEEKKQCNKKQTAHAFRGREKKASGTRKGNYPVIMVLPDVEGEVRIVRAYELPAMIYTRF
jgi:hypothetical protein